MTVRVEEPPFESYAEFAVSEEPTVREPAWLAGEGPVLSSEELLSLSMAGPVSLVDAWDVQIERPVPDLLTLLPDGRGLFMSGRVNVLVGEPSRGKSLVTQRLVVEEAQAGHPVLFVDAEKDVADFVVRMKSLGMTRDEAAYVAYWQLDSSVSETVAGILVRFVQQFGVRLTVLDGVGRLLARARLSENDNDDVRRWFDERILPVLRAADGSTILMVDHYRKPSGDSRKMNDAERFAKGASAKLEMVTGVQWGMLTVKPFSRSKEGEAKLVCTKSNSGDWTEGDQVLVHVIPHDGGDRIEMEFAYPEVLDRSESGLVIRPWYQEQVSLVLEEANDVLSMSQVKAGVRTRMSASKASRGATDGYVVTAVKVLAEEGYVSYEPQGRGKATLVGLLKPYRRDMDRKGDAPF